MTKREFLDTVFALAPNEANAIMDAFDEYVDSNKKIDCNKMDKCEKLQLPPANCSEFPNSSDTISRQMAIEALGGNEPVGDPSKMDDDDVVKMWERIRIINIINKLPPAQPEPCENAVSRKAVQYLLAHFVDEDKYVDACDGLKHLPPAQPERIKGHWIEIALSNHTYKCSVCGRLLVNITDGKNNVAKNYPYCHCGADMRGEQDERDS